MWETEWERAEDHALLPGAKHCSCAPGNSQGQEQAAAGGRLCYTPHELVIKVCKGEAVPCCGRCWKHTSASAQMAYSDVPQVEVTCAPLVHI